ncbi:MAG: nuclear transport factor 2 family protein [Methyloceanibacter sp.]|uniref:nuclear transport factor 2 family protein n=1 Tax=Methyloceanibacter sp. TaxID=1965321 RepID=UPI003D6D04C8
MRKFAALVALLLVMSAVPARGDDVATIEAVDNAAAQLDEAFEAQNAEAIKALMTPDHVAVTHYYGAPQSAVEQIASLPDLKYQQTNLTEPTVTLLGPDAAMRTFTARLDGTFKGKPLTGKVFVTAIMVKRDGKWLEQFYQVTELEDGNDGKAACKALLGTYLTKNSAKEGSFASRSLVSFSKGGVASFTDSGEGGEAGFAPFTDGRGAWSCTPSDGGEFRVKATTLDFTSGAEAQFGRLDFDLAYDAGEETISGTATLYLMPLDADPLDHDALKDGRQFEVAGKRVTAP